MTDADVRRDWAKYGRRLVKLLNPKPSGPRSSSSGLRYMVLSQDLPAGDGISVHGHGKGKISTFKPGATATANGSSSVPAGSLAVDVYNLFNVKIKSGSTVIVAKIDGYWQFNNTICANQST